ncbi:MAG: lamin tail domain-containing protein [Ignavibacteriales bacterium]|nr:lamin tail domain-containing protein [Ignavibacteriales bacterium]
MKNYLILIFLFTSLVFVSCSRPEPVVAPIVVEPTVIKINEIYSRGVTTDPDWIEIYNASSFPVTLAGYKIYDTGGQTGSKPKMSIPAGVTIPAKGYYVIVTDIVTTIDPSGFGLSSAGEEVWLEDASGKVIDDVVFPAMDVTQTYSRVPDGGTWVLTSSMTKGTANK